MASLNPVDTTIIVAGKHIHFVELKLSQHFYTNHKCEIVVDFEELDERWMANPVKMIQYIGQALNITFEHKITGETTLFAGIVTNITMKGKHGTQNHIVIHGADPSIKLSDNPTMDSFVDKNLDAIVKEAVDYSGNGVEIEVNSNYTNPINFTYQYNETCHEFLNRLCQTYGENYYYNGTKLIFGKTLIGDTIPIKYDNEMIDYFLEANLVPSKFKHYSYLTNHDKKREESTFPIAESTGYLKVINDKSDELYTTDAVTPLLAVVDDSASIQNIVEAKRKKNIANMLRLRGTTQTCKIGIGNIITIEFPKNMLIDTSEGEFIITDVEHIVNQEGSYNNSFSGVRASLNQVPMPSTMQLLPIANPQQAKVRSNADPNNQGRIQVEFQWQEARNKTTNWIRVQTPDAGGSDKVSSNRGLVTIPEEGDTVMVGFEFGNPDKPFSMGSLFSCKSGGGGGQGNKTKSLTSRCGNSITLDDETGSILIRDKSGSESKVTLDGKKNIKIEADKSVDVNVGKGKCVFNMKDSGEITITAEQQIKWEVGGSSIIITTEGIDQKSSNNKITGKNQITGGDTKIDGGNVFIN